MIAFPFNKIAMILLLILLLFYKNYVDSHANALIDSNFFPGDTVAVWLKDSAEKVCKVCFCLFTCRYVNL